jgi:4-hydroxybenzoate polyprenyltransferase
VAQEKTGLKTYLLYLKERFPIVPALLISAVMYCSSYFFSGAFNPEYPVKAAQIILGIAVVFLVTFHLRIFDEHKDFEKDVIAHPERMLSKGIVTLKDLRMIAYVIIPIEAALSIYLGMTSFIIWAIILIFTLLMLKEFFVPEFLNRHMGIYLVSHQLLVPLIMMQGFFQRKPQSLEPASFMIFFAGTMCAFMTFEIARKTWNPEKEHELADSYTKFWGMAPTVIVNQALAVISSACLLYAFIDINAGIIPVIVQTVFYVLFLMADLVFLGKPTAKNSKIVEGIGGLYTIVFFLNASITFYIILNR